MDDGELDFSNMEMFPGSNIGDFPGSCLMDSFFNDDVLKDSHVDAHACMHTHTCNPPGPDLSHTHTCVHVHTKVLSGQSDDKTGSDDTADSAGKKAQKRPLGNREAVRKYREKKKARTASLEDEVVRLRAVNQQLVKSLQGQAVLEAEVARLKCLLVDIRGRIEGEIGSFPYQKPVNPNLVNTNLPGAYVVNPCSMHCNDQVYCGDTTLNGQILGGCEFENMQCPSNHTSEFKELPGSTNGNAADKKKPNGNADTCINSSGTKKKKGGSRAATAG